MRGCRPACKNWVTSQSVVRRSGGPLWTLLWERLERIGVPMTVRIPLHVAIDETGVAAVLVIPLWSVVEKATGLIRSEISFVETGLYAGFGNLKGAHRFGDSRISQPIRRDDEAVHVIGHEPPWFVLAGRAEPDFGIAHKRHE